MMKYLVFVFFGLTLFAQTKAVPNALIDESSPYLQQHAYNPVKWYPWGDSAFEKAKKEHKPIFLSVGYSTCHWCHVMAKESFENEAIAALLNRDYIAVKVDREELPQLDSYYQQLFFRLKHRTGGWPLNAVLDENRNPFFVGIYIPPDDKYGVEGMKNLLPRLAQKYKEEREAVNRQVTALQNLMAEKEPPQQYQKKNFNVDTLMRSYAKHYDRIYHGFSIQPKFPEASRIALLFDLAELGKPEAAGMAVDILRAMALHGLYDHVEGGFFRYSTDAAWEIPHFEKMLYNQAELIPLYVKAYRVTKEPLFKAVVEETIEMTLERFGREGLYFAASSADTHHKEGDYFLFSENQIESALRNNPYQDELRAAMDYEGEMNFEGRLHLNFHAQERPKGFEMFRNSLQKLRQNRTYPFIDTKIITAWNAMMIEALYKAGEIDPKYGSLADEQLKMLVNLMVRNGRLYHQVLYGGIPEQAGLLEDYAFMISALIAGYEADYDKEKLDLAGHLSEQAIALFYGNGAWVQADDKLKVDVDLRDKYYTSSYGRMMQNLLRLAVLSENLGFENIVRRSLESKMAEIEQKQELVPSSATALLMQVYGVVVLKHKAHVLKENRKAIASIRYPYLLTEANADAERFLACKVDRCFAYGSALKKVAAKIEERPPRLN